MPDGGKLNIKQGGGQGGARRGKMAISNTGAGKALPRLTTDNEHEGATEVGVRGGVSLVSRLPWSLI